MNDDPVKKFTVKLNLTIKLGKMLYFKRIQRFY